MTQLSRRKFSGASQCGLRHHCAGIAAESNKSVWWGIVAGRKSSRGETALSAQSEAGHLSVSEWCTFATGVVRL